MSYALGGSFPPSLGALPRIAVGCPSFYTSLVDKEDLIFLSLYAIVVLLLVQGSAHGAGLVN